MGHVMKQQVGNYGDDYDPAERLTGRDEALPFSRTLAAGQML